uniref:Twitching motility protein PilT n=2 Tax=Caenorhabditis tropicalis TaxID=1561998 RepID=A0A1I7V494_9PELO
MALMDQAMRKLNLTDVHFMNPGNIVNVDTIVNSHVIQDKEELIRRMKQKVNDTANEMVRNQPQQVPEWNRARVKLPRPVVRNQSRIHSG